ncbi:MAG: radical SAM protein [Candidatus Scalinduaceae bacterium]
MNLRNNFKRITLFAIHRRKEVLTPEFWMTVIRVLRERFNYLDRVSNLEFLQNLQHIEVRPWNLHIEPTNICNAKCIFCAYKFQTRPKIVMSDAVYFKALDDYCSIGGGELRLHTCVGDPLLDPKLIERIKVARSRSEITKITTITNGINLDKVGIEGLLQSGITDINISTGPWDEKLYQSIYRSKEYHRVNQNVTQLLKINADTGRPVRIKISFRSNMSMKKTLELPDYQAIREYPHEIEFNTDFDTWLGEIGQKDLLDGMHIRPLSILEKEPCYLLYDGPTVFADGKVGLCGCRDINAQSELIIGNILESHFLELWSSEATKRLRYRFAEGDFPEICRKCTLYTNLDLYRSKRGSLRAKLIKEWFESSKKGKSD